MIRWMFALLLVVGALAGGGVAATRYFTPPPQESVRPETIASCSYAADRPAPTLLPASTASAWTTCR